MLKGNRVLRLGFFYSPGYNSQAQSRLPEYPSRLACCELSGESGSLVIVDCGDLVSNFRSRLESGENSDLIFADLEYGVLAELEEFARRLLVLLSDTLGETNMVNANDNGLSTSSQQAKFLLALQR